MRAVAVAQAVLQVEAVRACAEPGAHLDRERLKQAIRQADLLLLHYADPGRWWRRADTGALSLGPRLNRPPARPNRICGLRLRSLPAPGQRSVWDFPRPPALEPVPRVTSDAAGSVIADTMKPSACWRPPAADLLPADGRRDGWRAGALRR